MSISNLFRVDHKPLNIKSRNANLVVLFILKNHSSHGYLYLLTGQSCPVQYGGDASVGSEGLCRAYVYTVRLWLGLGMRSDDSTLTIWHQFFLGTCFRKKKTRIKVVSLGKFGLLYVFYHDIVIFMCTNSINYMYSLEKML